MLGSTFGWVDLGLRVRVRGGLTFADFFQLPCALTGSADGGARSTLMHGATKRSSKAMRDVVMWSEAV